MIYIKWTVVVKDIILMSLHNQNMENILKHIKNKKGLEKWKA